MVRQTSNLLPAYYQTDKNYKFLASTLDQLIQTPEIQRLNGYIGSFLSPMFIPLTDIYISDPQPLRNNYQLLPALVIRNDDTSVAKAYGYDDLINQLSFYGSNVSNLNRLFRPDYYSYDPKIDWDKFVNYNQYYWLPTGPDTVTITGAEKEITSTYTVTDSEDKSFFVFSPDGLTIDPLVTLYRGVTYVFNVDSDYNFYIKTGPESGPNDLYNIDIINNGIKKGQIIVTVTDYTPNTLYYTSDDGRFASGQFVVKSVTEDSYIDISSEILGKAQYTSANGIKFINGLQVTFGGSVYPSTYAKGVYIVEGVGSAISLVDIYSLKTPEDIADQYDDNFDGEAFDDFPFDDFETLPLVPEYITINRASKDLNPWTRYNRWFHIDVLKTTAAANGRDFVAPSTGIAQRPIIEFKANLQLYNFGSIGIQPVDYIDTITKDAFSQVENSSGYWIDGSQIEEGDRVIFNADPDPLVQGRVFRVHFVIVDDTSKDRYRTASPIISLVPTDDNIPPTYASVVAKKGNTYGGTSWWFNGTKWIEAQQHKTRNEAPLFDVVDSNRNSFSGSNYSGTFKGTKIFGYKIGSGPVDSVLGFPLSYQSTALESTYLFENYFMTDSFVNVVSNVGTTIPVSSGYLVDYTNTITNYVNVWTQAEPYQLAVQQFQVVYNPTSSIPITVFDNPSTITDLSANVFVNNVRYSSTEYSITTSTTGTVSINFTTPLSASDTGNSILFNLYTSHVPNSTGVYEVPINLTNNPLNGTINEFTLSEIIDHVRDMANRDPEFEGKFPGSGNLGMLPNASKYGARFVSNKNSIAFSQYFISDREHNLISAIRKGGDDYNQFKLNFIKTITSIQDSFTPADAVDYVLDQLNQNKNTSFPYFMSDMVPYGTNKKMRRHTVTDPRNVAYPITDVFDITNLSNNSVLIYLNDVQLVYGLHYTFDSLDPAVIIQAPLTKGDVIVIYEYLNTDGCYIPPTPTKLGLYPKFVPMMMVDDSYVGGPQNVIQGHDGSLLLAFNDYRDAIILEYETRIFNNIKVNYDPNLFDINSVTPGRFRNNDYSYSEIQLLIQDMFIKWTGMYNVTYDKNLTYDINEHKTYNYKSATDYIFGGNFTGSWRSIYKYYFDTDRPDLCPWEMLGFYIKPDWWDSYYGPSPYTAGNAQLWTDLEEGYVAQGPRQGFNPLYARPGLSQVIPVDDSGNLLDIREWGGLKLNDSIPNQSQDWAFGDIGPAENAYRRSSNWPFAVQIISALAKPADYANKLFDTSRMTLNLAGQYTYSSANKFASPSSLFLQGDTVNGKTIRTSGYGVYVLENGTIRQSNYLSYLKDQLANGNFNLFYKVGGFVNQNQLNISVDSYNLSTQSVTPFLPNENYSIFFNTSNPVLSIGISGVIIIKTNGKYLIKGYDKQDLYFTINEPLHNLRDTTITVGGQSATYLNWASGQAYQAGQIVFYENSFYRVNSNYVSSISFDATYNQLLSGLPTIGGITVQKSASFSTAETKIPYGSVFETVQEVYDVLQGYGNWLTTQGFVFDEFNNDFGQVINWDFTTSEFIYWTTQNWANNSVITLSPFADTLTFNYKEGVVDNLLDSFYDYAVYQADGTPFPANNFSIVRSSGIISIKSNSTTQGIFFARLNLVQKEHTLIFDNTTVFNDVIYDIESGYRQLRMKLQGFKTGGWTGDFFSPGFVYDNATVQQWTPYASYMPADVVRYVGKYYSAIGKITGSETFDFTKWYALPEIPKAQLLPNFDYKINQFEDFYSLDIENFDASQQKMAQHLTGYSPRPYLDNIFSDQTAQYKFYQGYIKEKGTLNALTKLEKAAASNMLGTIDVNEEWAFRMGAYGSFSSYNELEFPLREHDFIENNQAIQFVGSTPVNPTQTISYISSSDLLISPKHYSSTQPFATVTGTYKNNTLSLPYAGYVRLDDATYTFTNTNAILAITNNSLLNDGDKLWIGFDYANDWSIYRYTRTHCNVIGANQSGADIIFTTNKPHGLYIGQLVSITELSDTLNNVYQVSDITTPSSFTVVSNKNVPTNLKTRGVLFQFAKSRFDVVDDIANIPFPTSLKEGELFWVDDNGHGLWSVYRKQNNFRDYVYPAPNTYEQYKQQYGYKITKRASSTTVIVSAAGYYDPTAGYGRLFVYEADPATGALSPINNYGLNTKLDQYRPTSDPTPFGDVVFYDDTDDLIFAAASAGTTGTAITDINPSTGIYSTDFTNDIINCGLVKIAEPNRLGTASLELEAVTLQVLYNPGHPVAGSYFGSSIYVQGIQGNKTVLIGAPGKLNSTVTSGTVYVYNLSISESANTYGPFTGTVYGSGSGASFNITISNRGYTASVINSGTGYTTASVIVITGDQLGGISHENDVFLHVNSATSNGSIVNLAPISTNFVAAYRSMEVVNNNSIYPPSYITTATGSQFGYKISGSRDGSVVAISAPGYDYNRGIVFIYKNINGVYQMCQTIDPSSLAVNSNYNNSSKKGDRFGNDLAINEDGTYLFVTADRMSDGVTEAGKVGVYTWNGSTFDFAQLLDNPAISNINFGNSISVNPDASTIVVTGQGAPFFNDVTFDQNKTTFDNHSTNFGDIITGSGSAYVYERYNKKFIYNQELLDTSVNKGGNYGYSAVIDDALIYVGNPDITSGLEGSVHLWNKQDTTAVGLGEYRVEEPLVDLDLIDKSFTIDTLKGQVLDYLDIIDPIKGRIAGVAEQEITYRNNSDPAIYDTGPNVVVDSTKSWKDEHVGEIWWDISTVKYVWYEQGDILYRKNAWGLTFPGSTIDIYEWVESTYQPSTWASLADTPAGLTQGISGQPKFPDNSVYSTKQLYDKSTGQFTTYYYYWVKNSTVVPSNTTRRMSSNDVSKLIYNPESYGAEYISITGPDSINVTNYGSHLIADRISLNIGYDSFKTNINRHTEWAIIQENSENSMPTSALNQKLIDSLLGHDTLGNPVPDPNLTFRQSYGIEIRPRQSMFVNRLSALRNVISFANDTLLKLRTKGFVNFDILNSKEEIPNIITGLYDQVVEDIVYRDIVMTDHLRQAQISCTVINGKIDSITIDDPGYGYMTAPTVTVGDGLNSVILQTSIDGNGRINFVEIINPGSGFVTAPTITVRPYTVILLVDPEFNNKWSEYQWVNSSWVRIHTQTFDTTKYWKYVDWVDPTYNPLKPISYSVGQVYEVVEQESSLSTGDYVKVLNGGDGNYIILRKTAAGTSGTFDNDFDIIYSQNGTIQILEGAWNVTTDDYGYDQVIPFDETLFDQNADIELSNILTALKQDLFSGVNRLYWNQFFFAAVRYAITEQPLLDWAFKTSFINVTNKAGVLDQRINYRYQDPTWYQDYLNEIKPYHTQIRNYQVNYQIGQNNSTPWEPTQTFTSDFDLPAYFNTALNTFTVVTISSSLLSQYPYKSWIDNYTSSIEKIILETPGSDYKTTPIVTIVSAPGDTGAGATAQAYISNGKLSFIQLTNPGSGYFITPTVVISGGGNLNLTTATAYAQLTGSLVRSNFIRMKFDRITATRELGNTTAAITTTTNGTNNVFDLQWASSPLKNDTKLTLDGLPVLKSTYTITNYTKVITGNGTDYTKWYSKVTLNFVPKKDQVLTISYKKNIELYNAVERIEDYYSPTVGMLGTDTAQLMYGIEYPGITVQGLPFNVNLGFGDFVFGGADWDDPTANIDTEIDGGNLTTATNGQFLTALGYRPSDIVLDGDGFVTPYTSYAPEECVPGQMQDTLSMNVFTRSPEGSPVIVSQSILITSTTSNTTANLTFEPPSIDSVLVSFNNTYLHYGIDYEIDLVNTTLTINTQTTTGVASITVVGVGGTELYGSTFVTTTSNVISFNSRNLYNEVGSVYVTVNGRTINENTGTLYYTFVEQSDLTGKITVYGMPEGTNTVQAWYFEPSYKAYSELKQQVIQVETTSSVFNLIQVPGILGPFEDQTIVTVNGSRLVPPNTTYYQVENNQTTFIIHPNEDSASGAYSLNALKVYQNGIKLNNLKDFILDQPANSIVFNTGFLSNGDVLAIETLNDAAYIIDVLAETITFTNPVQPGDIIDILTFTNGDASGIRTEQFPANQSGQYVMARQVFNDNYVWVSIDGKPLIKDYDYAILSDGITVSINKNYSYSLSSRVVITSISDQLVTNVIGFKLFRDILGRTQYKRFSNLNSTVLTSPLNLTDTEIYVKDSSTLTLPSPTQNLPGIIFINEERIEFMTVSGNVLGRIKRATLGTGALSVYPTGTPVVDMGTEQTIPDLSFTLKQIQITTSTTTTYVLNTITNSTSTGDGIVLNPYVNGSDQIEVYYAGILLNKTTTTYHYAEIGFDTGDNDSDTIIPPQFTVNVADNSVTINLQPESGLTFSPGMKLTVIQRKDAVWYTAGQNTPSNGVSLLSSITPQAQFLLERQSGIPDKYLYEHNFNQ